MDAVQAAAEASTNGAEPVVKSAVTLGGKLANVSANLGLGFMGISLSGVGVSIAVQSFKAALVAAKS